MKLLVKVKTPEGKHLLFTQTEDNKPFIYTSGRWFSCLVAPWLPVKGENFRFQIGPGLKGAFSVEEVLVVEAK